MAVELINSTKVIARVAEMIFTSVSEHGKLKSDARKRNADPVSYTHLTLPTILRV